MKKQRAAVFLFLFGLAPLFAGEFSLSAGAGGMLGGFFTRYNVYADGDGNGARMIIDAAQEMNQFNYGFYAFVDAVYGEFGVSYQNSFNTYNELFDVPGLSNPMMQDRSGEGWESCVGLSLLGKYPFYPREGLTLFPMLGVEYRLCLLEKRTDYSGWVYDRADGIRDKDKDGGAFGLEDWNSFWIQIGGGADLALAGNFFLRGELLYGFRLMTSYESKNFDLIKSQSGDPDPSFGGLTSGPMLRLSAGYNFSRR